MNGLGGDTVQLVTLSTSLEERTGKDGIGRKGHNSKAKQTKGDDSKWRATSLLVIVLGLGAGILLLDTGLAIKCFNCNSAHQADCADWFDNVTNHLVECFSWQTKCRKIVQEAWYEDHWDVRYIRQCAGDASYVGPMQGKVCLERYGSYNVRIRYCHCDNQDGCNSAPAVTSGNMAGLCATLLLALLCVLGPRWMCSVV